MKLDTYRLDLPQLIRCHGYVSGRSVCGSIHLVYEMKNSTQEGNYNLKYYLQNVCIPFRIIVQKGVGNDDNYNFKSNCNNISSYNYSHFCF